MINGNELDKSVKIMRAMSHPLRLEILNFISGKKVINVNEIYRTLNLEQSATSQHLKILRDAEIVITKRDGKFIFYTLNWTIIKHIEGWLNKLDNYLEN